MNNYNFSKISNYSSLVLTTVATFTCDNACNYINVIIILRNVMRSFTELFNYPLYIK